MTTEQAGGDVLFFTRGDRLRKARERLGLDQGPFADLIGFSRGLVSNYESDKTERVKPGVMKAWALATGVDLEWLETGTDPVGGPTGPGGGRQAPQGSAVAKLAAQKRRATRAGTTAGYLVPATAA